MPAERRGMKLRIRIPTTENVCDLGNSIFEVVVLQVLASPKHHSHHRDPEVPKSNSCFLGFDPSILSILTALIILRKVESTI